MLLVAVNIVCWYFSFHFMSSLNLFSYATEEDSASIPNKETVQEEKEQVDDTKDIQTIEFDKKTTEITGVKRSQPDSEQPTESKQVKQDPSVSTSSNVDKAQNPIWKAVLDKSTNRYYYWNKVGVDSRTYSIENK